MSRFVRIPVFKQIMKILRMNNIIDHSHVNIRPHTRDYCSNGGWKRIFFYQNMQDRSYQ